MSGITANRWNGEPAPSPVIIEREPMTTGADISETVRKAVQEIYDKHKVMLRYIDVAWVDTASYDPIRNAAVPQQTVQSLTIDFRKEYGTHRPPA